MFEAYPALVMVQLAVRIQPTLLPWRPQGQIWPPWHSSHLLAECEGKILGLHSLSQSTISLK